MSHFDKFGPVVGVMRYGTTVEFWFHSLDGDSTDSRQLSIEFPTEQIADSVANAVWHGCSPKALSNS